MNTYKRPFFSRGASVIIVLILLGIAAISVLFLNLRTAKAESETAQALQAEKELSDKALVFTQGNSLMPVSVPAFPRVRAYRTLTMVLTAYSSTVWQTDDTPFITASGEKVNDGIVANNLLPFGTKIRIPEIYGDKIFTVEDRMNERMSDYHIDIWFPGYEQAKNFGAKTAKVEILNN